MCSSGYGLHTAQARARAAQAIARAAQAIARLVQLPQAIQYIAHRHSAGVSHAVASGYSTQSCLRLIAHIALGDSSYSSGYTIAQLSRAAQAMAHTAQAIAHPAQAMARTAQAIATLPARAIACAAQAIQ